MNLADLFLPDNRFGLIDTIRAEEKPWAIVTRIGAMAEEIAGDIPLSAPDEAESFSVMQYVEDLDKNVVEISLKITGSTILPKSLHLGPGIVIGKGTKLDADTIIKAPCVIGERCEMRQGAYLRGNVIVGNDSVIGHVTEIKNSIVMDDSAAGHFAYIGDSIVGGHVNLGAGVKLANLQFRSRLQIDRGEFPEIVITKKGESTYTGYTKLGAIIGDYTEIGCNSVTSPGTIIGAEGWVYPNTTVQKGFYQPKSVLRIRGASKTIATPRE
jgi:NDP-sugar pyrophosphorylase family protein